MPLIHSVVSAAAALLRRHPSINTGKKRKLLIFIIKSMLIFPWNNQHKIKGRQERPFKFIETLA
ncbi:hypothetical protein AGRO_2796 [Agrobacterium sp. ATCC 31749]|nr:hypothetical protein AGRO_2796 [Agrobacterium sp. ATCC 31749]